MIHIAQSPGVIAEGEKKEEEKQDAFPFKLLKTRTILVSGTVDQELAEKVGREVDGMAVSGIAHTGKRVPHGDLPRCAGRGDMVSQPTHRRGNRVLPS